MPEPSLRINQFEPTSRSNGPGLRSVVWVQGCTLACPGCFNPHTHDRNAGQVLPVNMLLQKILENKNHIEGVTISGGEPLQQRQAITAILSSIKQKSDLSVICFSGFSWREIQKMRGIDALLMNIDVLLAGRYIESQRVASSLVGSANKTIHFLSPRYTLADFKAVPVAEVILAKNGEIVLSGIDPIKWDG